MAPSDPPSEIIVRVKVPPGHIEGTNNDEFALGSLSSSLTVATLRQRIQTLVPSSPAPVSQRILYGGRALIDDAATLADALNTKRDPTQTEYVVHLLIRNGAGNHARAESGTPITNQQASTTAPTGQIPSISQPLASALGGQEHVTRLLQAVQQGRPAEATQTNAQSEQRQFGAQHPHNHPTHPAHPHHHHHHHHHGPHAHFHPPPNQPHASPFQRPISGQDFHLSGTGPDGRTFAVHHHQQTINMHGMPQHGQPALPLPIPQLGGMTLPGLALPIPFPGMNAPQNGQPPGLTALDRARENMTEMRRMLETMRNEIAESEQGRTRVAELERRMQAVNDYIDPMRIASRGGQRAASPQSGPFPTPTVQSPQPQNNFQGLQNPLVHLQALQNSLPGLQMPYNAAPNTYATPHLPAHLLPHPQLPTQRASSPSMQTPSTNLHSTSTNPGQTSVYLLSSPRGPQALVFSPQHGTYRSSSTIAHPDAVSFVPQVEPARTAHLPVATPPVQLAEGQAGNPAVQAQPAVAQQLQAQPPENAQQADQLGFLQPVMGHFWLLFRIMIFAYFLMGANMGWRRPVALILIGLGFWLIRLGLFGNGGLVRRWWEGVVRIEDVRERLRPLGLPADAAVAQNNPPAEGVVQPAQIQAQERPFPTPEELAHRLLQERRQVAPLQRLREQIRPAERALALFIASLWPGVGERYVQALDRAREEEEAARLQQRAEEERQRSEAETQQAEPEQLAQ